MSQLQKSEDALLELAVQTQESVNRLTKIWTTMSDSEHKIELGLEIENLTYRVLGLLMNYFTETNLQESQTTDRSSQNEPCEKLQKSIQGQQRILVEFINLVFKSQEGKPQALQLEEMPEFLRELKQDPVFISK